VLTFLSPLFLAGAAAAAVPIVLHLLKREPEPRVKFAAVMLLKRAPVEDTSRHRLRELLLLALRVATLVLLAFAFARPFFASGQAVGWTGVTIVALDTSYSMAAPRRFERAKQLARDAISSAPSGDLVGVVTFADQAEVAARPSVDRVLAASAVDQAAPGFGATRYRSALSTAAQALADLSSAPKSRATIVVVTDLQESGWDEGDRVSLPERVQVQIADVGPLPANAAVTAIRPLDDRLVATVRNTGPSARDLRVRLTIDGRAAGEATAAAGPNQSADVTFAGPFTGTAAAVTVEDPDGLAADNVRYAALTGGRRPGVLAVSANGSLDRDAFYVQHALAAGPGGGGYDVSAMSGGQLSAEPAGPSTAARDRLSSQAAVLLLSTRGLERRGRELLAAYVHAGGGLLVAAGAEVDGDVAADVLGEGASLKIAAVTGSRPETRTLAPADLRHPIFRLFAGASAPLTLVRFRNATRIEGSGCQTLARFTTGDAALLECGAGDGRALIFASDLDNAWNDFPQHASFVPFLHEAVRYLASARAHSSDYLVGETPAGVPREPGVHPVRSAAYSTPGGPGGTAGPGGPDGPNDIIRRVVVNVDPRESDPARLTVEEFQGAVTRLKDIDAPGRRLVARQQEDDQHLWQYALILMIVALAVEGVIAGRTA
jgi:hypothetical protein